MINTPADFYDCCYSIIIIIVHRQNAANDDVSKNIHVLLV